MTPAPREKWGVAWVVKMPEYSYSLPPEHVRRWRAWDGEGWTVGRRTKEGIVWTPVVPVADDGRVFVYGSPGYLRGEAGSRLIVCETFEEGLDRLRWS